MAYYRHSDWLGSSRLTSSPSRQWLYDGAYAPFGESYAESPVNYSYHSFTGENEDTVQGLDDFLFREYSSAQQGRWISPDPAGLAAVSITDPQSWNRYSYAYNRPCGLVDIAGLTPCTISVGINFFDPSSASFQKNVEKGIQNLFGSDINLNFVVGGIGQVNLQVGGPLAATTEGAVGATPNNALNPSMPLNHGSVDFGLLLTSQYALGGPQGLTGRLAGAVARSGAHELAHELFVGHSSIGGLMSPTVDVFQPATFTDQNLSSLLYQCKQLNKGGRNGSGAGGGVGGGGVAGERMLNGPGWDGGLHDFINWVNSIGSVSIEVVTHSIVY